MSELSGHFDKCQQLLNSISGSLGSKTTMVMNLSFFSFGLETEACFSLFGLI